MKFDDGGRAFTIWLSAADTTEWARGNWPASQLSGRRIRATFAEEGLVEFFVDGRCITKARLWVPVDEFNALVADYAKNNLDKDHPCYYVAVGQFAR